LQKRRARKERRQNWRKEGSWPEKAYLLFNILVPAAHCCTPPLSPSRTPHLPLPKHTPHTHTHTYAHTPPHTLHCTPALPHTYCLHMLHAWAPLPFRFYHLPRTSLPVLPPAALPQQTFSATGGDQQPGGPQRLAAGVPRVPASMNLPH